MKLRSIGTAVLVAGLTLGISSSASASQATVHDERGDLWRPVGFDGWEPRDAEPDGDLRRTTVKHQDRRIRVELKYVELVRARNEMRLLISLKVPGQVFELHAELSAVAPRGFFTLTESDTSERVACRITGAPSYARKELRVNVPRTCLGNPEWVRFQGRNSVYDEVEGLRVDDVRTSGAPSEGWSRRLATQGVVRGRAD